MVDPEDIATWKKQVPWTDDIKVEKDLIISKALLDIYSHPLLRENLGFRGGTALNKLHRATPARYSEDIDLVQINEGSTGPDVDIIRSVLDPWLGEPRRRKKMDNPA